MIRNIEDNLEPDGVNDGHIEDGSQEFEHYVGMAKDDPRGLYGLGHNMEDAKMDPETDGIEVTGVVSHSKMDWIVGLGGDAES